MGFLKFAKFTVVGLFLCVVGPAIAVGLGFWCLAFWWFGVRLGVWPL